MKMKKNNKNQSNRNYKKNNDEQRNMNQNDFKTQNSDSKFDCK